VTSSQSIPPAEQAAQQVSAAREVLRLLNFDAKRCNERSARVLLALLSLTPTSPWDQATNQSLRTREIMDWIAAHYQVRYAPNTRETIRKETLYQFVEAGLVERNHDDLDRATNSPKYRYRVAPTALALLQTYKKRGFDRRLRTYLADIPGLVALYARERQRRRIPVTFPDGMTVTLSPGGQNILLKHVVENFCQFFTPGGHVLYIGDTDAKWAHFEEGALASLNITVKQRGKMPDLVVYLPDKNWLVLLEAAASHGPVDAQRRAELADLFDDSTAGLVYVSCFLTRAEMRRYLAAIAWETEVWCADNPTHLIHFNGERFLGPY